MVFPSSQFVVQHRIQHHLAIWMSYELKTKYKNNINDKPGRAIGSKTADRGMMLMVTMMMMMMMMMMVVVVVVMMMMMMVVVVVVMVIDGDGDGDDDDDNVDDEGKELEFSLATLHCQSIGSLYIDSFRREPVQGLLVRYWPTLLDIAIYWINL